VRYFTASDLFIDDDGSVLVAGQVVANIKSVHWQLNGDYWTHTLQVVIPNKSYGGTCTWSLGDIKSYERPSYYTHPGETWYHMGPEADAPTQYEAVYQCLKKRHPFAVIDWSAPESNPVDINPDSQVGDIVTTGRNTAGQPTEVGKVCYVGTDGVNPGRSARSKEPLFVVVADIVYKYDHDNRNAQISRTFAQSARSVGAVGR
jgi:hypothetical protein